MVFSSPVLQKTTDKNPSVVAAQLMPMLDVFGLLTQNFGYLTLSISILLAAVIVRNRNTTVKRDLKRPNTLRQPNTRAETGDVLRNKV